MCTSRIKSKQTSYRKVRLDVFWGKCVLNTCCHWALFLQGEYLQRVCSLQHLLLCLRLSKGEENYIIYLSTYLTKAISEEGYTWGTYSKYEQVAINMICTLQWQFTTGYNNLPLCVLPEEGWLLPMTCIYLQSYILHILHSSFCLMSSSSVLLNKNICMCLTFFQWDFNFPDGSHHVCIFATYQTSACQHNLSSWSANWK